LRKVAQEITLVLHWVWGAVETGKGVLGIEGIWTGPGIVARYYPIEFVSYLIKKGAKLYSLITKNVGTGGTTQAEFG